VSADNIVLAIATGVALVAAYWLGKTVAFLQAAEFIRRSRDSR
jgi:hypothetical protein